MASVRLSPVLVERLARVSKMKGKSVSCVIREAVTEHCDRVLEEQSLAEALNGCVGVLASRGASISSKVSEVFGEILEEKRLSGQL
ncbi:MAG TPA: ribbon-helix-helix protein, CopG family [Armatimonadota bacterium]|nr:ribbon-helix-helix protein, CopG family [Armatimonadota bacterium]